MLECRQFMMMRDRGPPRAGAQSLITRPVGRLLRWRRNTGGTQEEHRRNTGGTQEEHRRNTGGTQEEHRRNKVIAPTETQTQRGMGPF